MVDSQRFSLKTGKFGGRRSKKVNAAEKFGVEKKKKSVRLEVKKMAKLTK